MYKNGQRISTPDWQRVKELEKCVKQHEERAEYMSTLLVNRDQAITHLRSDLSRYHEENIKHINFISELERAVLVAKHENQKMRQDQQIYVQQVTGDFSKRDQELYRAAQEVMRLRGALQHSQRETVHYSQQVPGAQEVAVNYKVSQLNQQLGKERTEYFAELQQLKHQLVTANKNNQQLNRDQGSLALEMGKLSMRCETLTAANEGLRKELAQLKQMNASLLQEVRSSVVTMPGATSSPQGLSATGSPQSANSHRDTDIFAVIPAGALTSRSTDSASSNLSK